MSDNETNTMNRPTHRLFHVTGDSEQAKVLKNDKRAIFTASGHAQRAATYLHDLQPPQPEPGIKDHLERRRAPAGVHPS